MEQNKELKNLSQILINCWKLESLSKLGDDDDEECVSLKLQIHKQVMSMINKYLDDKWDDEKTWKCYTYLKDDVENFIDEGYSSKYNFFTINLMWNESCTIEKLLNILMAGKITIELKSIPQLEIGDLIIDCYKTHVSKVINKRKCKGNSWIAKIENVKTKSILTVGGEYNVVRILRNNDFENPAEIIPEFILSKIQPI